MNTTHVKLSQNKNLKPELKRELSVWYISKLFFCQYESITTAAVSTIAMVIFLVATIICRMPFLFTHDTRYLHTKTLIFKTTL